jgi:acyl-coenzyme A thioesterase PaaI-like protein
LCRHQQIGDKKGMVSLQKKYAPKSICFGCGPNNPDGLHVESYPAEEGMVEATFQPLEKHQAFPGVVNGGIIGAILDCHSNWTASYLLMKASGSEAPPCTVTADFHVKLRAPTPLDCELQLKAYALEIKEDRVKVKAELSAHGRVTATCEGTFVAVRPGHPAYHRWEA